MLIEKNRNIVAVNKKCAEFGMKVGTKCSSYGKPEQHKGCRANEAADEKKTIRHHLQRPFRQGRLRLLDSAAGKTGVDAPFSIGITMEYEEAKNVTITKDIVKDIANN